MIPIRALVLALRSFAGAFVLCTLAVPAFAAHFEPRPVPGRLLLQLQDWVPLEKMASKSGGGIASTGQVGLDALNATFGATAFTPQFAGETRASKAIAGYDLSRYFIVDFDPGVDLESLRRAYAADASVAVAEFDMMHGIDFDANDMGQQWYLESVTGLDAHLSGGWNHSQGSANVILAIADSGVDWQHPDLGGTGPNYVNGNIWINSAEYNGAPGVDDDGNGKVDDVRGWDFVNGLSGAWPGEDAILEDNDPSDFNGHGTHVAGIASASTNNGIGVSGVGFNCKVMALRIGGSIDSGGNEQGVVLMSAAASALNYARQKGAAAFNCSWGSSNISSLAAAVSSAVAQGMVIVVAAGNDNSEAQSYLASRGDCFDVAASGNNDNKASFSNYGTWVDVTAPGVGIYSTYFNHTATGGQQHTYTSLQGTSMAAPVVTGLVGLVKAHDMALNGTQIKEKIKFGCDSIDAKNPAHAGKLGAGRVNALRMFGDYFITVPEDYAEFAKAMAASGAGDTLALLGGTVFTNTLYLNRSDRLLQGGWDATYTSRDPIGNPTIVDAFTGPSVWVPAGSGVQSTLEIDGVRFIGGNGTAISSPINAVVGGALLCQDGSPTFRNCSFESSVAGDVNTFGAGGGAFLSNSAATFVNCHFTNNAAQHGGGIYVHNATVRFENCVVDGNTVFDAAATTFGAGIFVDGGAPVFTDLVCNGNTGADEGGGLYVKSTTLTLERATFDANTALASGGNVRLGPAGGLVLRASDLRRGQAQFGAGISAVAGTTLDLTACVLASNTANFLGGGISTQGITATLLNVTWNDNRAALGGGDAIYATSCTSPWTLSNSIVSNHPTAANAACFFSGAAPALAYNVFWNNTGGHVAGASLGGSDLVANPLYADAPAGNLALGLHSPAIDSADPAVLDPDASPADRGGYGGPLAVSPVPAVPSGLQAAHQTNPLGNQLGWDPNSEPDVTSYAVYRGAAPGFVPSASNYVGSAATSSFLDPVGLTGDYYRIAALRANGASSGWSPAVQAGASTDVQIPRSRRFALHQNAPNPFNPSTLLRFEIPAADRVRLVVHDASGRVVRRLLNSDLPQGTHEVLWDGRDDRGNPVGSGVYVYRVETRGAASARKMILIR